MGFRSVERENATGAPESSKRVQAKFTISAEKLEFDAQTAELRVLGSITEETPYASLGQRQTLTLEPGRDFTITKDHWDSVARNTLQESLELRGRNTGRQAYAVIMEEGFAHVCILLFERTVKRQTVDVQIPKKRNAKAGKAATSGHEKGKEKFYQVLMETMLRHISLDDSLPILLASPGFVAQGFLKYVLDCATRDNNKALLKARDQFIVVHSSSGHLYALNEVLRSPEVAVRLKDTKFTNETKIMDNFMEHLRKDDGRAWYGPREVERAVEKGGVGRGGGVLLINNALFRSDNIEVRKRWVALVDRVKEEGGDARVLSSEHESGKRLEGLGGIAAILTYPMEDLNEEEDEELEDDGGGGEGEGVYGHRTANSANGINNGVGENILS